MSVAVLSITLFIALCLLVWKYQQSAAYKRLYQHTELEKNQLKAEFDTLTQTHYTFRENAIKTEAILTTEIKAHQEKLNFLNQSDSALKNHFQSACAEALKLNQETFLQLAQNQMNVWQNQANHTFELKEQKIHNLITPIKEALTLVGTHVNELEKSRQISQASLNEQLQQLVQQQLRLEKETRCLAQALRNPQTRGQWGEIQLKRVVEMAGMLPHVEFREQSSLTTQEGRLRPDMIIFMPNEGTIAIDAKVPLNAYLEAIETHDPLKQKEHLKNHARQVKERIQGLSLKSYWKEMAQSPEFVILFLPAEPFLSAALTEDPTLLEFSSQLGVVLATPTTLIALLKTIAYGWKQDVMAKEAKNIITLGQTLYERIATIGEHWDALGNALLKMNQNYNKAINSLETRLFPIARQLESWNVTTHKKLPHFDELDNTLLKKRLESVAFNKDFG